MPQYLKPSALAANRVLYGLSAALVPVIMLCHVLDRMYDSWLGRVAAAAYFVGYFIYAWSVYANREDEMGQRVDLLTTRMAYRLTVGLLLAMLTLDGTPLLSDWSLDQLLLTVLVCSTLFYGGSRWWAERRLACGA